MQRRVGLAALVFFFLAASCAPPLALAQRERSIEEEILVGIAETVRKTSAESIPKTVLIKIKVMGQEGYGSGAIVSADGQILTCAHVVEPGSTLVVVTCDGREFEAEKLGLNATNDYALIKIDARDLPHFEIGDSDGVRVRDWVVALGHPGGPYADLRPAVAVGRVRSLHQKVPVQLGQKYYDDAIQTDCPIFGGNSGGPLVDLHGELVGINGAINPASDSSYSVPANEIAADLESLRAGRTVRGRSGPGGFGGFPDAFGSQQDREAALDAAVRVATGGMVVASVERDGTAQMSGLLAGDVITHIAGMPVEKSEDLERILGYFRRGESTLFEVVREGTRTPVVVTFGFDGLARDAILRRGLFHLGLEAARSTVRILTDGSPAGYGVVLEAEGWILTSATLVASAQQVAVQLYGGEPLSAEVVGREGRLDVALLKIDPAGRTLVPAETGDAERLAPGDWVVSGGDFRGPLVAGVVSATGREVGEDRKIPSLGLFDFFSGGSASAMRAYPEVIQHDSNLVPSLFGSPLLDVDGRLVGINVGNAHRGTSYAIPIHRILAILDELKGGLVVEGPKPHSAETDGMADLFRQFFGGGERPPAVDPDSPFLGVQVDQNRMDERGVVVGEVVEETAAAQAGIRTGDVIVRIAGDRTLSFEDLAAAIRRHEAGDEVVVTILRDGEESELRVTLGRRGSR